MTDKVDQSASHADEHYPVMRDEVLRALKVSDGERVVDGTFGAGGYSRAILAAADCYLYGIDQDESVKPYVKEVEALYGERFTFMAGQYSNMEQLLLEHNVARVDSIVLDIGVSSMQLDQAERGFSFMREGALDMRMGSQKESAADVVNGYAEERLADIIYQYGEERKSRIVARKIVEARESAYIGTTLELAQIIEGALGRARYIKGKKQNHPATRTFQALRIYVNDELGELERGLEAAERLLNDGGRLCVVTFHSLEDGIVKRFFNQKSGNVSRGSRHMPERERVEASFKLLKRGAIKPSEREIADNVRSRSAKLRYAIRIRDDNKENGDA